MDKSSNNEDSIENRDYLSFLNENAQEKEKGSIESKDNVYATEKLFSLTHMLKNIVDWFKSNKEAFVKEKNIAIVKKGLEGALKDAAQAMSHNDAKAFHKATALTKETLVELQTLDLDVNLKNILEQTVVNVIFNADKAILKQIQNCNEPSIINDSMGIIFKKNVNLKRQGYEKQQQNLDAFLDKAIQAMMSNDANSFQTSIACIRVAMLSITGGTQNKSLNAKGILEESITHAITRVPMKDLSTIYSCTQPEIIIESLASVLHEKAFLRDIENKSTHREKKLIDKVSSNPKLHTKRSKAKKVVVRSLSDNIKKRLIKMLASLKTDDPSVN